MKSWLISRRNLRGGKPCLPMLVGTACFLAPIAASAQAPDAVPQQAAGANFVSVARTLPSGGVKLANGKTVKQSDWPAVAISQAALNCTATLVGRNVLLTSAHCVDGSPGAATAQVKLGTVQFNGEPIPLEECAIYPDYFASKANGSWPRHAYDFALCRLKYPVNGVTMESLGKSSLTAHLPIVMMGFGCSAVVMIDGEAVPVVDTGQPVLRLGEHKIAPGRHELLRSSRLFVRTISDGETPALCPRDSGGPVFGGSTEASLGERTITGLASAWDPETDSTTNTVRIFSYLAPADDAVLSWMDGWGKSRGLVICGIHQPPGQGDCRG